MTTIRTLFLLTMIAVLAACGAPTTTGTTPTADVDVSVLEARIAALEAHVTAEQEEGSEHSDTGEQSEAATSSQEQVFAVTMALNVMDTAGLHGMDENLNAGEEIDPGYAGTIQRLSRITSVTPWPEDLTDQAMALRDLFNQFEEALANDDATAAAPLATQVHEAEHELSHEAGAWINAQLGVEGEGEHAD